MSSERLLIEGRVDKTFRMASFSVIPLEQDDDPLTPISTPGIEQKNIS